MDTEKGDDTELGAAERLRLLDRAINAAGEGICITGPNEVGNPLVYVNHGFEQLTGYPATEVLGQNMRFLQGPDTDRAAVDRMRAADRVGAGVHNRAAELSKGRHTFLEPGFHHAGGRCRGQGQPFCRHSARPHRPQACGGGVARFGGPVSPAL